MSDWPPWFQRLMLEVEEDLQGGAWPPPPIITQLPDGTWQREQYIGWGNVVTFHATLEQARDL